MPVLLVVEVMVRDPRHVEQVHPHLRPLSTQFTCFTSTKVHIGARELGVRDARHVEQVHAHSVWPRSRMLTYADAS